jgi:hypothetical protein
MERVNEKTALMLKTQVARSAINNITLNFQDFLLLQLETPYRAPESNTWSYLQMPVHISSQIPLN